MKGERFARTIETAHGQLLVMITELEEDADMGEGYVIENTMSFAGGTVTAKAGPFGDYDAALAKMDAVDDAAAADIAGQLSSMASQLIVLES